MVNKKKSKKAHAKAPVKASVKAPQKVSPSLPSASTVTPEQTKAERNASTQKLLNAVDVQIQGLQTRKAHLQSLIEK